MPRTPRVDYPEAIHHLMLRGVARQDIFRDDEDRGRFVMRLETALHRGRSRCFAWALMPNHIHLLLETGARSVSSVMHLLGTTYAMDFNRRHERVGHLFQNRFLSVLVESEAHFLAELRYIHLNPVVGGIVPDVASLETYPWTGHAALVGRAPPRFLDESSILPRFGANPQDARAHVRVWMENGIEGARARGVGYHLGPGAGRGREPAAGVRAATVLSATTPVQGEARANARSRAAPWTLPRILEEVCDALHASREAVLRGRRTSRESGARAVAAFLAWELLGLRQSEVARGLLVSGPGVTHCLPRGKELVRQDRARLAELVRQIRRDGSGMRRS